MKIKLSILIIVSIILITTFSVSCAEKRYPEWLEGTFCINLYYSETVDSQYRPCLYCINFDSQEDTIIDIDSDAVLMKDSCRNGRPLIVSSLKSGYDIEIGRTNSIWREYDVYSVVVDKLTGRAVIDYGLKGKRYDIASSFKFDAPLAILGFDSDHEYVFLLQYGVSIDGGLEIQMVRRKGFFAQTEDIILHRFPIDYKFGMWKYAISSDGNVAWFDPEEKVVRISSENGEIIYHRKIVGFSGEICWLDENNLLYFEGSTSKEENQLPQITYTLMKWDATKNVTQKMITENGKTISFKVANVYSPYDIAISPDHRFVSSYYADMEDGLHKIMFFSLKDGQSYTMSPWMIPGYDEYGVSDFNYDMTEEGGILIQPNGGNEVNCEWY